MENPSGQPERDVPEQDVLGHDLIERELPARQFAARDPWAWFKTRYFRRAAILMGVGGAAVIVAVLVYGVVLFVFEPEDAPGASRVTGFKCLTRAERAYFRQLRRIAGERREHLDSVQATIKQLETNDRLSGDPQWRQSLSTDMANFTISSRAMAQVSGPESTGAIQKNLLSMSASATQFAKLYLQGTRDGDAGAITRARLALRDTQLRMLRTQELGEELCD